MGWFRRIFIRLRWKLMAAYAVVTTVALVVLIFVAMTIQGYQIIYEGDFLGHWYFHSRMSDAARFVAPAMQVEPAHEILLEQRLEEFLERAWTGTVTMHQPPLTPQNVGMLVLFDPGGKVLATNPPGVLDAGVSLRKQLPASGDVVVNKALFGPALNAVLEAQVAAERDADTRHLYVAAAVHSQEGTVLGGVLLRYDPNLRDVLQSGFVLTPIPLGGAVLFLLGVGLVATVFGLLSARWITRRLGRFVIAAESWSRADFSPTIQDVSRDELGGLARNLNRMADQLRTHFETRTQLAAIEERNRVARDLHDAVKQQVFAAAMQIGAAREHVQAGSGDAAAPLERAEQLTRDAGRELTRLIRELRPAELEGRGLVEALRELAQGWGRRHGIAAEVRARGERVTPLETEQALFRVAQEALNNVARHSGASRVELDVVWSADAVTLRITDDGTGFDGAPPAMGMGIRNMQERIAALGGTFAAGGGSGQGRVTARCPMPEVTGALRPGAGPRAPGDPRIDEEDA